MAIVARYHLRKVEVTATKDFGGGDTRQVPAAATVDIYKQGAMVRTNVTVSIGATNVAIDVRDLGRIIVGDTLVRESDIIAGTVGPPTVTVDQINASDQIRVDHTSGGAFALTTSDRLIITNNKPTLYSENGANATTANPGTCDGTTGYYRCYVNERFVDIRVSGSGLTSQMLRDHYTGESGSVLNALEFPSVKAAVDALNNSQRGEALYFPAGFYSVPSADQPLTITKSHVRLYGESLNASQIAGEDKDKHLFQITTALSGISFEHLSLSYNIALSAGTGDLIHFVGPSSSSRISTPVLRDLLLSNAPHHCVFMQDVNYPLLENVECSNGIKEDAFHFYACAQVRCIHCYALGADNFGIFAGNINGFQWDGIGVESCQTAGSADLTQPMAWFDTCDNVLIARSDFEEFNNTTSKHAITFRACRGVTILSCQFPNASGTGTTAIEIEDNNQSVLIGPNWFQNVGTAIKITNAAGVATAVSSDVFVCGQVYSGTVTTHLSLPNATDRTDKRIIIASEEGLVLPCYTDASEPAGTVIDGAIWYRRDGTAGNRFIGSHGGQVSLG